MKTLTLNKKELIELWNLKCDDVTVDSILERIGDSGAQMCSIHIDKNISLSILGQSIKIIFGGQIEYLSEGLNGEEFEKLDTKFSEAEETIMRLTRDRIISNGIKSLEILLDD